MKLAPLAVAAAALLAAPAAAATITLTLAPTDETGRWSDPVADRVRIASTPYTGTTKAGRFAVQSDDAALGDFLAFCVELSQGIGPGGTFEVAPTLYTGTIAGDIDRLFDTAYDSVTNATSAAAFQLSLWEIITDSGIGYDLDSGGFLTSQDAGTELNPAAETIAEGFLAGLGGPATNDYELIFLESADVQDLVTARLAAAPEATVSAVPLPGAGLLLLGALGGMTAMRARRG